MTNKDRVALILLSLATAAAGIGNLISLYMHNRLLEATNELAYCWSEGWDFCEIEKDGLNYNVYYK